MAEDTAPASPKILTIPGKILATLTFAGGFAGVWVVAPATFDGFPPTATGYLWILLMAVVDIAFFLGMAWVLEKLGIHVFPPVGKDAA